MSTTLRRWSMALAGVLLGILGVGIFAKAIGLIGDAQIWLLWVVAFPALGASRLLLTRVFGAGRFKGLALAGERLGLTLERQTGELVGRIRGISVRVYPGALRRQAVVEVRDGVDVPETRGGLGDPWERKTARKIEDAVRSMVVDAERSQRRLIERMKTGAESFRAGAVRKLAAIPEDMRIPEVADALSMALVDVSPKIRLAAAAAKGSETLAKAFDANDEPLLASLLADPDSRDDAARVLARIGTIESLVALRGAERTDAVALAIDAIKSRTGAEGGRISLAGTEGGELSIPRQAGELSKLKE